MLEQIRKLSEPGPVSTARLFSWLSTARSRESREVSRRLLATTFDRKSFVYFGSLSVAMLTISAGLVSGAWWPFVWLAIDLVLLCIRLFLLNACARAKDEGRQPPLGWLMAMGGLWSLLTGLGCLVCVLDGHPVLCVLAALNIAAMLGGISSRNAATPRYAMLAMALISVPFSVGTFYSPLENLFVVGLQAPLHLAGMIMLLYRNHDKLVRMLRAELRNRELAMTDYLTGLANRVSLAGEMAELCVAAKNHAIPFAVLSLDLDGFKEVNDRHGHAAGDKLLSIVAQRIKRSARIGDLIARTGGDEFVIALPNSGAAEAAVVAARLIEQLETSFFLPSGPTVAISVSIGSAFAPQDGVTPEALLACSDAALYQAKRGGKGRYVAYAGTDEQRIPLKAVSSN